MIWMIFIPCLKTTTLCVVSHYQANIPAYLKVLPSREGEEGDLSLLWTPGLTKVRVPDERARLHARIKVQGNVFCLAVAEVDSKAETHRL